MVDAGEQVSTTLMREFCEESLNILEMDQTKATSLLDSVKLFFSPQNGQIIYKGVVDDPRNTDNAWMETVAVNFHDESGQVLDRIQLNAGDDAKKVQWMDMDSHVKLYANHFMFIEDTVKLRQAHW